MSRLTDDILSKDWRRPSLIFNLALDYYMATEQDVNMPVCPCCDRHDNTTRLRRLNTLYPDELDNWIVSCIMCYVEGYVYYQKLFAAYESNVL
jgi:hypothetical protein